MHTNALYLQDNAAVFGKDMKNSTVFNVSTAPLLMPRMNGRMSQYWESLSEYEIPLDEKWEFPRAWYVKALLFMQCD